jgi:hypothetical protein
MSQTQPEVNKLMLDIFGDSDDEDEELPTAPPVARVTAPKPTTGRDVDGLFESDEEDNVPPLKIQKTSTERGISKKVVPSGSVKKRTPSGTSDGASKKQRTPLDGDSSDEYDSDGDVEKTAEDEAFIDAEDDNADLLNEYDEERQNFRDERPTHKTGKAARDSGDRATKADDPVSQVLADLQVRGLSLSLHFNTKVYQYFQHIGWEEICQDDGGAEADSSAGAAIPHGQSRQGGRPAVRQQAARNVQDQHPGGCCARCVMTVI